MAKILRKREDKVGGDVETVKKTKTWVEKSVSKSAVMKSALVTKSEAKSVVRIKLVAKSVSE